MGSETPDWRQAAAAEYVERRDELLRSRERTAARLAQLQNKLVQLDMDLGDLFRGAKAFGLPVAEEIDFSTQRDDGALIVQAKTQGEPGQFKDVALQVLKERFPMTMRAPEVQAEVESRLGRSFHWKTAGMTLYRLKKDGLVNREGQKWAYAHHPGQVTMDLDGLDYVRRRQLDISDDPGERPPDDEDRDWRD